MIAWHYADLYNRMYVNLPGGKKCAMPRYFKQKIYTEEERQEIGLRTLARMADEKAKIIATYGEQYFRDLYESYKAQTERRDHQYLLNQKI